MLLSLADLPGWLIGLAVMSLGLAAEVEVEVDLVAFLSSRYLGMKAYGKIYGWQLTAFYLGAAVGPLAAGLTYDRFQSYLQVLCFAAAALLFGAIEPLRIPKRASSLAQTSAMAATPALVAE